MLTYTNAVLNSHERYTLKRIHGLCTGVSVKDEHGADLDARKTLRALEGEATYRGFANAIQAIDAVRDRFLPETEPQWWIGQLPAVAGGDREQSARDLAAMRVQHIGLLDDALTVLRAGLEATSRQPSRDETDEADETG
jgi:hypothetical protein